MWCQRISHNLRLWFQTKVVALASKKWMSLRTKDLLEMSTNAVWKSQMYSTVAKCQNHIRRSYVVWSLQMRSYGLRNAYLCDSTARLLHNQLRRKTTLIACVKAKYSCLKLRACIGTEHGALKQKLLCRKGHVMRGRRHVMRAEVLWCSRHDRIIIRLVQSSSNSKRVEYWGNQSDNR